MYESPSSKSSRVASRLTFFFSGCPSDSSRPLQAVILYFFCSGACEEKLVSACVGHGVVAPEEGNFSVGDADLKYDWMVFGIILLRTQSRKE